MPYHIDENHPDCSGVAVVKDDDGEVMGCHDSMQAAMDQMAALHASESDTLSAKLGEVREFVRTVDPDLQRVFDFEVEEVRDSGAGGGIFTVKGHAAVFGKWSLDLGGFRERIKRGAFADALSHDPHVLHVWDHDTSKALSSTRSQTYPLELREDPQGLRFYSKVAPTSYSEDLRVLLEGGVVTQSSFAFTVANGGDEWKIREENGQEVVERTITKVDELFDVTTCAMGAYPTTDSALAVRSLSLGRQLGAMPAVAPRAGSEKEDAPTPAVTPQTSTEDVKRELARLKRHADTVFETAVERGLRTRGKS